MTPDLPAPARFAGAGLATVAIDDHCTACGGCLITCPEKALRPAPRKPLVVDARCNGCGLCIEICPVDAIGDVVTGGGSAS